MAGSRGLDEAQRVARRASFDLVQREALICVGIIRSYDALISAARGDLERVRSLLPDLHTPSRAIDGIVTFARATGQRALGDLAGSRRSITTSLDSEGPRPTVETALLLEELADLALEDGDDAQAQALVDQIVPGEAMSLTWVVALRARAVAHRDADAARRAVDGCRAIGLPLRPDCGRSPLRFLYHRFAGILGTCQPQSDSAVPQRPLRSPVWPGSPPCPRAPASAPTAC